MEDIEWLASRFEQHRPRLRAVAYQMLGSLAEADDAVQDTWLRLSRAGADDVDNLGGWLTTIVARVSLNMLRSRKRRREESLEVHVPDPVIGRDGKAQPEDEALIADSVGLALLVVLDTLTPDERLAFVLHDMFDLPFNDIAALLGRSTPAAKQLASRARRRVRGAEIPAEPDHTVQRRVVDAFFAAARQGDFGALVMVLHPGVVLRIDAGTGSPDLQQRIQGAAAVARQALFGIRLLFDSPATVLHPVLVNGSAGVIATVNERPLAVMSFIVAEGKIIEIDSLSDPSRLPDIAAVTGLPG